LRKRLPRRASRQSRNSLPDLLRLRIFNAEVWNHRTGRQRRCIALNIRILAVRTNRKRRKWSSLSEIRALRIGFPYPIIYDIRNSMGDVLAVLVVGYLAQAFRADLNVAIIRMIGL
jgi:hypothetical protein